MGIFLGQKRFFWSLAVALVTAVFLMRMISSPLQEEISWSRLVLDENGQVLRLTLSEDEKFRVFMPLSQYPQQVIQALLFKEDRYFNWHFGVNPVAMLRAVGQTYFSNGRRVGASTLSMQLARLMTKRSSRDFLGKFRQILAAVWIEIGHSKAEILEAYLNLLPFGGNVEGFGTASQIYFRKPVERLSDNEIFTLAVIPQSPKLRAVGMRGEIITTPALLAARDRLFSEWRKSRSDITNDHAEAEQSAKLPLRMHGPRDLPFVAPHFTDDILRRHVNEGPSILKTTLNRFTQKILEMKLKNFVERHQSVGVHNAAAMLVDWRSNEVKAELGSVNYFDSSLFGQVNATRSYRSPGSTLKPFVYGLAFDQGLIHNQSLVKDAPTSFGGFDPENFDKEFQGPITVEDALIRSRNLPAVAVAAQLKEPSFYDFLKAVGIGKMKEENHYGLSTVLGGKEVKMEDLVRLYSMLANQGQLRSLKRLQEDQTMELGNFLSPESSAMVLDILSKLPAPAAAGGSQWSADQQMVYWKTGTSQGFRDAWTIGIVGPYVLAVWLGNFNGDANPAFVGRDLAAPLFFEIIDALKATQRIKNLLSFSPKLNLKQVKVCSLSGQLPGKHCHHQKWTWFIPGKSPISECDIHREIEVDQITGFRLCPGQAGQNLRVQKKVVEFWPSDLMKLFAQAGLPRKRVPAWDPNCALDKRTANFGGPRITSPRENITYSIRASNDESSIALSAVSDGDVRSTFWFVDNSYLGSAKSREHLFWKPKPGSHLVRVVDDQGRSASRELRVQVVQ